MFIAKEKALYKTLNMMKWQNQSFIGYFWAPVEQENTIRASLSQYQAAKIMAYDNHTIPRPTYFKPNEFSYPFQQIVDTYGVPTYLEANPAVIAMVTFPFFFGMMFGDMGHGSVVLAGGIYLTLNANNLKSGVAAAFVPYRYLFLMMGMMSVYCGFIYNEFFAINTSVFQSCYDVSERHMWNATKTEEKVVGDYVYMRRALDCNYPAGQDPVWGLTSNKLTFVNGVKMKMSVIFGIIHMSLGIIMKGTNNIFFRDYVTFFTEVCTGLVILLGLFGWMDALIIAKWFTPVDIQDTSPAPVSVPFDSDSEMGDNTTPKYYGDWINERMPSVINIMIKTVFNGGDHPKDEIPLITDNTDTQYHLGIALLLIVIALIPIMLFVKPCCCAHHSQEDDRDEIEFTNIRNDNEMQ
jgi:V-type H+-transporting ATPase subunit a